MKITTEQSAARVRAGLGRPPQDALESTVVLEAFGGLVSPTALRMARGTVDRSKPRPAAVVSRRSLGEVTPFSLREVLGLVATLLATTTWVGPLTDALGDSATARAWKIALPVSLFLQWMLRRRHLNGPQGLGLLRADHRVLAVMGVAVVGVCAGLVLQPVLVLPAALILTWVGGLLIVIRGWGIPYAACLLVATLAIGIGVPVVLDIIAVVLLTAGALGAALWTTPATTARPATWRRSLAAAAVGGTTGLLIVLEPAAEWSSGAPFPVFALVPSLLASAWAGHHLNRIWTVLLGALASTSLLDRDARPTWRVFAGIVLGAVSRLLLGTALLSAVSLLLAPEKTQSLLFRLLVGLGAFGVVNFVAALLESFSRVGSAMLVAASALVASLAGIAVPLAWLASASPLVLAALVAGLVAVVPIIRLVRQPDRTIATLI